MLTREPRRDGAASPVTTPGAPQRGPGIRLAPSVPSDASPPHRADSLSTRGNLDLLSRPTVGILASVRVPPDLILPAFDAVAALGRSGASIVAGFQTPLERELLTAMIRRGHGAVVCRSASLDNRRLPRSWTTAIAAGRLLLVSATGQNRPTGRSGLLRNQWITQVADAVLVVHATAGGRVYRVVSGLPMGRLQVYCLRHPRNADLELMGARGVDDVGDVISWLSGRKRSRGTSP